MSDDARWVSGELRETLDNGDLPALVEAGLLPARYLSYFQSYKKHVSDAEDRDEFQEQLQAAISERVNTAVDDGNLSVMSHANGIQGANSSIDASGWGAADVLTDTLWRPSERDHMLNLMVYGPTPTIKKGANTGKGKTDFAYTCIDGGIRAYASVGKTLQVASNNDTDDFATVESWSEAEEWMQDTDGPKVLLLDEAAQGLKNADMGAGDVLSKAMRLMRKYQCHLILIAHTGKDIPLDVRRSVVFARKESKKKVTLGNKLDEDKSGDMQIANVEFELTSLPATSLEFESIDDKGEFEWDLDDAEGGGSDLDVSQSSVQCHAETNSGGQCPASAAYPLKDPVVCHNHRGKQDAFLDD